MNKEFEKLLPNKRNTVTLKVPFSTADAGIIADAIKVEDIGNFDKTAELLDNGIMMYDKETGTWSMKRDLYVDSICNEDGEINMNVLLNVDDIKIGGAPIEEFISDKVQLYGLTIIEGDGIDIVDADEEESTGNNTKKISLAEIDDLGGGTVGSSTKIPVITYDKFGRITYVEEVDIGSNEDEDEDHNHNNLYYTKTEVNALIQAALNN